MALRNFKTAALAAGRAGLCRIGGDSVGPSGVGRQAGRIAAPSDARGRHAAGATPRQRRLPPPTAPAAPPAARVPGGRALGGGAGRLGGAAVGPRPSQRTPPDARPALGLLRPGQRGEDPGLLGHRGQARADRRQAARLRVHVRQAAAEALQRLHVLPRPAGPQGPGSDLRRGPEQRQHVGPRRGHQEHHVRHRLAEARRTDRHAEPALSADRVGHPQPDPPAGRGRREGREVRRVRGEVLQGGEDQQPRLHLHRGRPSGAPAELPLPPGAGSSSTTS